MSEESVITPVAAGLAIGIAFVSLFSISFNQPQIFPTDSSIIPGQFKEAAIKIALQNSTFLQEFEDREMIVAGYRDWGVSHGYYDCPFNYCAAISFADESEPRASLASVLVNMQSGKVIEIRASRDYLVAKMNDAQEVESFLIRYPSANISVDSGRGYSEVIYEAETITRVLSLVLRTTPSGDLIGMHAECFGGDEITKVTDNVADFIRTNDCLT